MGGLGCSSLFLFATKDHIYFLEGDEFADHAGMDTRLDYNTRRRNDG
jgi:hypothetical protein